MDAYLAAWIACGSGRGTDMERVLVGDVRDHVYF